MKKIVLGNRFQAHNYEYKTKHMLEIYLCLVNISSIVKIEHLIFFFLAPRYAISRARPGV